MGVEDDSDRPTDLEESAEPERTTPQPVPDQPGAPSQPSRLESYRAGLEEHQESREAQSVTTELDDEPGEAPKPLHEAEQGQGAESRDENGSLEEPRDPISKLGTGERCPADEAAQEPPEPSEAGSVLERTPSAAGYAKDRKSVV